MSILHEISCHTYPPKPAPVAVHFRVSNRSEGGLEISALNDNGVWQTVLWISRQGRLIRIPMYGGVRGLDLEESGKIALGV